MKVSVDGISCLREAISSVPVPGAPPRLSLDGAAVGLAFLDAVLRQNHVRRLTERLHLIEHQAARCTTEVDISLGLLDQGQREAGILYQRLRNRSLELSEEESRGPGSATVDPLIWVPVSRLSRRSHSPIDVFDADGVKLPRLTQYETSRLMASAMYRLLRAILSTHPDARKQTNLNELLFRIDESRWLIQAALVTLLTERARPAFPPWRPANTPGTVHGHGARYRAYALDVLSTYEDYLLEYTTLLDIAVHDYLLVVALDSGRDEHLLAFDSPLHVYDRPRQNRLLRPFRSAGGAYWVEYGTNLPASLRAYHLVAETDPSIHIDTMYLTSNADNGIVERLGADLDTLSHRLDREQREPAGESAQKLIELELQGCLRSLSELLRRRSWEASQAELKLTDAQTPAAAALAWACYSGEGTTTNSGALQNSLLHHPLVTPQRLLAASREVQSQELWSDLCLETDPVGDRAHVYWRRDPSRLVTVQTIRISASMFLRDAGGSRPGSILSYVGSVVVTSYLVGCLLFGSFNPYFGAGRPKQGVSAEAIIAVLLLVPGFLYTRLDLPVRQSIMGQLRALPRFVAHVAITCAALLAATIAANANALLVRAAFALCLVVPAAAGAILAVMWGMFSADLLLVSPTLPRWAREVAHRGPLLGRHGLRRRLQYWWLRKLYSSPDATFSTSGVNS